MPIQRCNVESQAAQPALTQLIEGVKLLKAEVGPSGLSTYDAFVLWHYDAMMQMTPIGQLSRNAAHKGPVFLPWHRYFILAFERHVERVTGSSFALPYWNWCADGMACPDEQPSRPVWAPTCMGGVDVEDGPFAFDEGRGFVLRLRAIGEDLVRRDTALKRVFRANVSRLPSYIELRPVLPVATYDSSGWDTSSEGFRSALEGGPVTGLHDQVHGWIGGSMGAATSPNDPVFFLHHANVDRIWTAWQRRHGPQTYAPSGSEPDAPAGHRLGDRLVTMLDEDPVVIADLLDVSWLYEYDTLDDLLDIEQTIRLFRREE